MHKWYGNIDNRIDENKMFCDTIMVGTDMTEYLWSDRRAYEVIEVKDQKHIKVREYDHERASTDTDADNNWRLVSNPNNPARDMVKRGKYWYFVITYTKDSPFIPAKCYAALMSGKETATAFVRANVSFGIADYYFDYEF